MKTYAYMFFSDLLKDALNVYLSLYLDINYKYKKTLFVRSSLNYSIQLYLFLWKVMHC